MEAAPTSNCKGGHYGNALLSRFPIAQHKSHLLPNIDASEHRGVIEAEITLPDSKQPLLLFATHLDFRVDDRERLASAKIINELAEKHQHTVGIDHVLVAVSSC